MEETIMQIAKKCGENPPDLRELQEKNQEIKELMAELEIRLIEGIKEENQMPKQKKYCDDRGLPMFAPDDGVCFFCRKQIRDRDDKHITGCERCNRSYCD